MAHHETNISHRQFVGFHFHSVILSNKTAKRGKGFQGVEQWQNVAISRGHREADGITAFR
jgi:hypothetical protein